MLICAKTFATSGGFVMDDEAGDGEVIAFDEDAASD